MPLPNFRDEDRDRQQVTTSACLKPRLTDAPKVLFGLSCFVLSIGYGVIGEKYQLFPIPALTTALNELSEIFSPSWKVFFAAVDPGVAPVETIVADRLEPGLVMYTGVDADSHPIVSVIDRSGQTVHQWQPDFFEIWGEDGIFPRERFPRNKRYTYLHGLAILPNGDIVANFEHLSTVRLDPCGNTVWKLDNLGHHSVHLDERGDIWVPAERWIPSGATGYRNHLAPLNAWTIQQISPEGQILRTIDLIEVLSASELNPLLYLSTLENGIVEVSGDTLHLNDVETLPSDLSSDVFAPGDLMLSLRNIDTVIVLDPETFEVKFRSTGELLRQHDPDFMPSDRISVFDNRNLWPPAGAERLESRIVELDARTGNASVALASEGEGSFFTRLMGDHQRLPNGNILVLSSLEGRLLEFLPDGRLAWRYSNRVSSAKDAAMFTAMVLPPEMDLDFFEAVSAECSIDRES